MTKPNQKTLPKYLKFLNRAGRGPYSGFDWPVNEWVEVEGPLEMCLNGLHVTPIKHTTDWLAARCHPVKVRGEILKDDDKVCVRAAKLGPAFETWNDRTARLFAADCAERVLHIFENVRPSDERPRATIEVVRRFAAGEANVDEKEAAGAAARAAAWDAAWIAASTAARDAAWAAAGAAARAAAWDAAWDAAWAAAWAAAKDAASTAAGATARDDAWDAAMAAERKWQGEHLAQILLGEVHAEDTDQ